MLQGYVKHLDELHELLTSNPTLPDGVQALVTKGIMILDVLRWRSPYAVYITTVTNARAVIHEFIRKGVAVPSGGSYLKQGSC